MNDLFDGTNVRFNMPRIIVLVGCVYVLAKIYRKYSNNEKFTSIDMALDKAKNKLKQIKDPKIYAN